MTVLLQCQPIADIRVGANDDIDITRLFFLYIYWRDLLSMGNAKLYSRQTIATLCYQFPIFRILHYRRYAILIQLHHGATRTEILGAIYVMFSTVWKQILVKVFLPRYMGIIDEIRKIFDFWRLDTCDTVLIIMPNSTSKDLFHSTCARGFVNKC